MTFSGSFEQPGVNFVTCIKKLHNPPDIKFRESYKYMPESQKIPENLVSVVIPVYNGGKYIQECLESIESQSFRNFECIINDNKSTDNTLEIARSFAARDQRFRVFENDSFLGQTENWNFSLTRIPEGSAYIKIVPADDWLFPEYLEKMVEVMEKYPETGICSSYRLDETEVLCDGLDYYKGPVFNGRDILYRQLLQVIEVTGSIHTVMYRAEVLRKLPGFPDIFDVTRYHIDTFLAYEVLNISSLGFVYQVLSFTRRHNETYTSQISEKFRTRYYFVEDSLFRYLGEFPQLDAYYRFHRLNYAFFLVKRWIAGDKQCLEWHKKYLKRPFSSYEYIKSIAIRLLLINRIKKFDRRKYLESSPARR
jgi:glycosyltransferase involved in cell wall biosynthesis